MSNKVTTPLKFEDARIVFKNFSGKPDAFKNTNRCFNVVISDHEFAEQLLADGWNVKRFKVDENNPDPDYHLQCVLNYDSSNPPRVVLVSGGNKTTLDEESVGTLDYLDIISVDLIANPYNWTTSDGSGVKPYIQTLYAVAQEDEFAGKYGFEEPCIGCDDCGSCEKGD